jgi:hypothetical protein
MFFTVMTTAACHALWNMLAVGKMLPQYPKLLALPLIYFVVGVVYSVLRCSVLALAIALVHLSLRNGMVLEELATYVFVLSFVCLFYSGGRVPNLYSM